jgi:AAA ATPase domain
MKIKGFQVLNYRCIIDSGWVDVDDLTVLVGKNESGKTSLLRALHKFSPFKTDPYLIDREWPRGQRHKRNVDAIVCSVRFELDDDELAQLYPTLDDPASQSGPFIISRTYSGRYHLDLPNDLFPSQPPKSFISELVSALENLQPPPNTSISLDILRQSVERIKVWAYGGNIDEIKSAGLSEFLLSNIADPTPEDVSFVSSLDACISNMINGLSTRETIRTSVEKFVLGRIPVFIYMDDYRAFRGSALLDMVKERKDRNELTDEDKTLITILELSGLDLDSEF